MADVMTALLTSAMTALMTAAMTAAMTADRTDDMTADMTAEMTAVLTAVMTAAMTAVITAHYVTSLNQFRSPILLCKKLRNLLSLALGFFQLFLAEFFVAISNLRSILMHFAALMVNFGFKV